MTIKLGGEAVFTPESGKTRTGTIKKISRARGAAMILLDGDPFAVKVRLDQLESCTETGNNVSSSAKVRKDELTSTPQGDTNTMTATKMTAKEMRQQAQSLGIEGWEDMGRAELSSAIEEAEAAESKPKSTRKRRTTSKAKTKPAAKKASTRKKAPAKKAAAKKASTRKTAAKKAPVKKKAAAKKAPVKKKAPEPTYTDAPSGVTPPKEQENPFRKGSNLHIAYPILVPRGGKRRTLAERLSKKVELHPYSGPDTEVNLSDYDKRLLLCAQTLRDEHGYSVERKGRGLDGTIKVFLPGSENDPRKASTKTTRRKSTSKK